MDAFSFRTALATILVRTKTTLGTIRTGRATPSLVDHLMVSYYGTKTPLRELASLSVPEPRMILIQAWDANCVKDIERAVLASDLGLTPGVEGAVIRLTLPSLTEETRREQLRIVHEKIEEAKVAARRERDELLRHARDEERAGNLSQDARDVLEKEVTKEMETFSAELERLAEVKEQELMTI